MHLYKLEIVFIYKYINGFINYLKYKLDFGPSHENQMVEVYILILLYTMVLTSWERLIFNRKNIWCILHINFEINKDKK